ncbi:MAG TPA: histone deacetylase family protein [Nocardioidaceae bacterium]|nr:histone deacetylase family protein [Nocardioidaceae bacterium]
MSPIDVVWSPTTREHVPSAEIWVGVRTPGTEVAERVDVLLDALTDAGHPLVKAETHDETALSAAHDQALLEHLASVYEQWAQSGIPDEVGQDRVVPYVFPTAAMLGGIPMTQANAVHGRAGAFCYDTMTLVGPGTWPAARAAADCALTAADRVAAGARAVYALSRPPGHHVTTSAYGGSCYLNNAAVAAEALRRSGHTRVAILDVDAHHGNGTSAIFYDRGDVLYGSVHVDPAAGWFPHYVGHASERGIGEGTGSNLNIPLAPGSRDGAFLDGVRGLVDAASDHGSTAVVVSLGVDAAADDPESPLEVTRDGYHRAGELLAAIELPTVLVQEGGYHLPSLGGLVTAFLSAYA